MPDFVPPSSHSDASALSDNGQRPVSTTARPIVRRRLRKAVRSIARCARASDLTSDDVHDLRVAIRRAVAALKTFRPLLPKERCRRLRKRLKHVRRVAGNVRDLDVLTERLLTGQLDEALLDLNGSTELLERRSRLVRKLRRTARNELDCELQRRARGIVRRVRWRGDDDEPTLPAIAPGLLRPIAQRCQQKGAADLADVRRLHRFRLSVKGLRYACEFVADGMNATAVRQLQDQLADLQQRLGDVCDRAAAIRVLRRQRKACGDESGALADLLDQEQAALGELQSGFIAWWEPDGRPAFEASLVACSITES